MNVLLVISKYGNAANWTDCFLTGPNEHGTHGQFKTGHDTCINLGELSRRTIQNCLTYQLYTAPDINPDVIAMGVPVQALSLIHISEPTRPY